MEGRQEDDVCIRYACGESLRKRYVLSRYTERRFFWIAHALRPFEGNGGRFNFIAL